MKFTESQLEQAIIALLEAQGYPYHRGDTLARKSTDVLLRDDLRAFLSSRYAADGITEGEIESILRKLDGYSAADLYESNRAIQKLVADGFLLKREDRASKDLYIQLIDYRGLPLQRPPQAGEVETVDGRRIAEDHSDYASGANRYRLVNQLEIVGTEKCIPDAILYINGLPLVVFEFKSAIRVEATLHDAHVQLTVRYVRDIPELMKYNALCVLSDGVNSKETTRLGSFLPRGALHRVQADQGQCPRLGADERQGARDDRRSLEGRWRGRDI